MKAELIFRLICMTAGIIALCMAVLALARRKMAETLCLVWGFFALLLILAGILLHPSGWALYLSGEGLILMVLGGVSLLAVAYFISVGVSELLRRMREAAIQISLLRLEESGERKELLILIPARNEEGNIEGLLHRMEEEGIRDYADILVIDDSSVDGTRRKVEEQGCLCITGIFHQGYGSALQTGYKYAVRKGYSYVIQMDGDGQHDVCNVQTLYQALRSETAGGRGPDIVLGSRFLPESSSFPTSGVRMLAIRFFRWILLVATGRRITDPTTGLQGLNARTLAYYSRYGCFDNEYPDANTILQMLLSGYEIQEVPAVMHARKMGKSMHSGLKPLGYMFRMAFSMSAVYIREKILKKDQIAGGKNVAGDL